MTGVTVEASASGPARQLTWLDAVAITVGIVIGSFIFVSPAWVAANTGTPGRMLAAWGLGGLLCLCGALCYAELATAYPHSGGEYLYLTRAFGRPVGFFFVWSRTMVIQTGAIAAAAYVFGDYMNRLRPLGDSGPLIYALAAAAALTVTNALGVQAGRWTQNVLTAAKVLGIVAIIAVGLAGGGAHATASEPDSKARFGLAMIFVLYTYGGWNEAAYVAGEVRRRGDMLKALLVSVAVLTLLYIAINLAFLRVLGIGGMAAAESTVAAEALAVTAGPAAGAALSVLVAIAALGSINGCIFTGARAMWALGTDFPLFRPLARWHGRRNTPHVAILVQGLVVVVLILLPGLGPRIRSAVGPGFQAAVEYTAPVFWAFLLLTSLSVLVLRWRDAGVPRPFRVPLFPLTTGLFTLMCAYMLWSSLAYAGWAALAGVAVLVAGAPLYVLVRLAGPAAAVDRPAEGRPPV